MIARFGYGALIGAVVGGLIACTKSPQAAEPPVSKPAVAASKPSAAPLPSVTKKKAMLTCRAAVRDGHFHFEATYTNESSGPRWVPTALLVPSGSSMVYDETAAYVQIDGDRVVVSKQMVPVPETIAVESPEVPRWSRVEPGASVTTKLTAPAPLTERMPYDYSGDEPKQVASPSEIVCELTSLPADSETPPRYTDAAAAAQERHRVVADLIR